MLAGAKIKVLLASALMMSLLGLVQVTGWTQQTPHSICHGVVNQVENRDTANPNLLKAATKQNAEQIAQLQQQLDQVNQEIVQKEEQIATLQGEIAQLEEEIAENEALIAEKQAEIEELQAEIDVLEEQRAELERQIQLAGCV